MKHHVVDAIILREQLVDRRKVLDGVRENKTVSLGFMSSTLRTLFRKLLITVS